MEENFSQRRARLIQLQRQRDGAERNVPKRKPAKAVFGKGAVEAAKFLAGKPAGMYSMSDVIG